MMMMMSLKFRELSAPNFILVKEMIEVKWVGMCGLILIVFLENISSSTKTTQQRLVFSLL